MVDAAGNQETIEIVYVVRADDAIANAEKMRSSINAIKTDIQNLASQSSASFREMAEGMKKAFGTEQMAAIADHRKKISSIRTSDLTAEDKVTKIAPIKEEIAQRIAAWREYKQFVGKALAELNAAESQYNKESIAREKDKSAQKKAIIKDEKAALEEYIRAQKQGEVMSPAAQKMGQEVQNLKAKIFELAAQNNKSFNQIGQDIINRGEQPVRKVIQAIRELNAETQKVSKGGILGFFQNLGSVGQFVFGSVLGLTAVSALRNLVREFQDLVKAGFEYAQVLNKLVISTNILQEKGYNITLQETLDLVKELNQEFPIFSRKEIIEGVGYIQLLSQNLTLTSDQMKNLAEVAGGLAVILGKDVNEASKELALFLSSGYGEALQRAGILASKAAVMHELLAMGVKTSYNETSAAIRAQAGYNVIMRDAIKLVEKAKEVQESDAYAVVRLSSAWKDLTNAIGIGLVPILAVLYDASTKVVKGWQKLYVIGQAVSSIMATSATTTIPILVRGFQFLSDAIKGVFNPLYNFKEEIKKFNDDITKIWSEGFNKALSQRLPDLFGEMKDSAIGAGTAIEEAAEIIYGATLDLHSKLTDAQDQFISDTLKLEQDFQRDLEKIDRDGNIKREDSWRDYYADAYAIARKTNDDFLSEEAKFQLDLDQINREYSTKKADAGQKYRDKEYKAQKDFEEKMRRLREEFLFDLEDALRERDARQVLRLIRRFNLDQARLEREKASERDDRQREYKRELADIDKQKAERLQKLKEEHQARMLAIKQQEAIELRELKIKHDAEIAEIDRRIQQEKDERELRNKEQQEDLKAQFKDRLIEIAEGLQDEYGLTKDMLDKIVDEYYLAYGPNGRVQQIYDYILAYASRVALTMSAIASGFGGYGAIPQGSYGEGFGGIPSYATGATNMLATSPKIIQVGEVPEMINITPLNRMSSTERVGGTGDKGGTINIELWLSPDLQARVMDNTLDQVADIMLNVQRRR
jgi:hypothetical protein